MPNSCPSFHYTNILPLKLLHKFGLNTLKVEDAGLLGYDNVIQHGDFKGLQCSSLERKIRNSPTPPKKETTPTTPQH